MNYQAAKTYILDRLATELSDQLYYHGLHHTLDVLDITQDLCRRIGVSAYHTMLLKTAALYHDAGFMVTNVAHESIGCTIVRKQLPDFGYTNTEIEAICGMIMATKIPQSPQNELEKIICDADLDYLGRNDFYDIGATLFAELKAFNILQSEEEWNRIQVKFLEAHSFLTPVNQERRTPQKLQHLADLKALVATY